MYNILSIQTHNICNIFWQLVNKAADCFNNIVFILLVKISFKKVCEKNGKQHNVVKGLTSTEQERKAVAVSSSNFWSQNGFSQKDKEEKFENSEKFTEKSLKFFVLYICCSWHLRCQISIESIRKIVICSTERTYDSVVLKIFFLNIITICIFIEQ